MMNFGDTRLPERFWDKVSPCPMSGCWLWFGSDNRGYGMSWRDGKHVYAHRMALEAESGPMGRDVEVDHRCMIKCCVNPAHLELVSHTENMRRANLAHPKRQENAARANVANRTHCKHGHEFTEANTARFPSMPGTRRCRTCMRR